MGSILLWRSVEITTASTSCSPTLTLTTTVTIQPIRAMVLSMPSPTMVRNGTIPITMDMETTLHLLSNPMHASQHGATAPRIASAAQTLMVTVGPMTTTGLQATRSNGSMLTTMDMVTTISTKLHPINSTSTNVEMPSRTMPHNGTTPMVTVTATTTKMFHGTNIELQNGPVKSSLVHKTSTSSRLTEPNGAIQMATGWAMNK